MDISSRPAFVSEQTSSVFGFPCEASMPADLFEYCQILSGPPDVSSWALGGMYPE